MILICIPNPRNENAMRNLLLNRLIQTSFTRSSKSTSLPFLLASRRNVVSAPPGEDEVGSVVFSSGLSWALASKGVIVKGKAFQNLKPSELKQLGATIAECLSGFSVYVRGSVVSGAPDISKAQFGKLVKQVTNHLSSIPNIFVHDGAIGSSPNCDAKVRVISDSPSALLSLSNFLYKTRTRSVSHDSCPLTVYAATSISPLVVEAIGVGSQSNNGIIAADMERSSLVLCGKAFLDASAVKKTLFLLSEPVISARGGIPLPGRILVSGDSVIVLFAPEDTIQSCTNLLVSSNAGTILTSQSISPSFQTGNTVSKLSPGQAAYHFLAGYQNGKFVPSFSQGPSCIDPLELAKALLAKLRGNHVHSYLININRGKKTLAGKDFVKLVESTLSKDVLPFEAKGGDLERKYKAFLSAKYPELPKDFTF